RELTRPLHRSGDLVLVPPAGSGDAARTDLAAIRDELPERVDVLVVDELDLVAAVLAGLAAPAAGSALAITPARRPAALLCPVRIPLGLPEVGWGTARRGSGNQPDGVAERAWHATRAGAAPPRGGAAANSLGLSRTGCRRHPPRGRRLRTACRRARS